MSKLKSIFYLFFPLVVGGIVGFIISGNIEYQNYTIVNLNFNDFAHSTNIFLTPLIDVTLKELKQIYDNL